MATQAAYIAATVAGLKRALKRKDYESDADSEIRHLTNRGWKDQKRARVTRLGRLAPPSGLETEVVEYGGYSREIVGRKPQLVDEDGYDVESDEDEDRIREATVAAAEFDPYANVHIDQILAPLSAITDIPTHPTLSRPFTSPVLSQLADQSSTIMRKENQSLWRTKRLLTKLCGDFDWVPCRVTMGATDVDPYADEIPAKQAPDGSNDGMSIASLAVERPAWPAAAVGQADGVGEMSVAATNGHTRSTQAGGEVNMVDADAAADAGVDAEDDTDKNEAGEASLIGTPPGARNEGENRTAPASNGAPPTPSLSPKGTRQSPVAQGPQWPMPSQALIHPLFHAPPNAHVSRRDVGLPNHEAEELRRLLTMWVQKQEEVCRGVHMINEGVLQADRLRRDVLHWAKAEAHCGSNRDISDGEDWYDKEEWGLVDDLKKGHDEGEEEEVAAGTTSKKTRARR